MLKIPKGLKKKKKGKKGKKKDDELFDAEELAELERYKKEKQLKEAQAAEAGTSETGEPASTEEPPAEEKEEWEKFKALTSGVDDILKKTQDELDRIKATSFYQKKPPGPSVPPRPENRPVVAAVAAPKPAKGKWVGFEEGAEEAEDEECNVEVEVTPAEYTGDAFDGERVEEEEESEFEDDGDDLFDTSYVDVVASGEVKLAYVPDSPEEEDTGPDPFDTSIVDKVIKVDPQEEKKKKLVSLGCAVEVLTGKLEKPVEVPPEIVKPQRRRPRPRDLLLGSFDDGSGVSVEAGEPEPPPKSILDEEPVFAEETSEILGLPPVTPIAEVKPISSPLPPPKPKETPKETGIDLKTLVEEFVNFGTTEVEEKLVPPVNLEPSDELDDEFAALAAESLHKTTEKVKPPKPPPPHIGPQADPLSDDEFNVDVDDPFDTSFASQVLPGKFELKLIEKEVLSECVTVLEADPESKIKEVLKNSELSAKVNFETDETLKAKKDLLGGSTSDLSALVQSPIAPKSLEDLDDSAFAGDDPFDTSVVEKVVAPGKTELKFLEKELLTNLTTPVVFDDDDFDPRADEKADKLVRPDNLLVSSNKPSIPKVVAFCVQSPAQPDLLAVDQEENSKVSKPLTPYYPPPTQNADKPISDDPFDTSYVSEVSKPGKLELQILEKELNSAQIDLKRSLSDPDFDPRGNEEPVSKPTVPKLQLNPDILSGDVIEEVKLHTPVVPQKAIGDNSQDIDPFDTSIASGLVPGKAEIKILETELVYSEIPAVVKPATNITEELLKKSAQSANTRKLSVDLVLEQDSEEIAVKPLTPVTAGSFELDDDVDPFDTSAVENILPGKTEIKLLESELLS